MADTSSQQPTVYDYATGTQWRLAFNRLPKTTWFCTAANIPGISLGEAQYPTPMADIMLTGDKLTFETLTITFIVDEELQNYRELWDWMVGIGAPKSHDQWTAVLSEGDGAVRQFGQNDRDPRTKLTYEESNLYSDATLIVYNSKNIAKVNVQFKNMFPTNLSSLEYSQDLTDVEYFHATASFRYLYYEFETVV
ncbi:MAG TPA: hypothetical protein EYQ70_01245 [Marine Group III euryarchaeote]|jgi:hypothetical protein|uniref:Phage tail protein n=1 Tax=Marine Group III euryarchaeote TaxID=2173149 RepID=A0A7J4GQZ0_9ARCH|nr:hypothetical protein [Marine Group III euryarchaeote]